MEKYNFRNQYNTLVYSGEHKSEDEAWEAFWNACKYPQSARHKHIDLKMGIRVEVPTE